MTERPTKTRKPAPKDWNAKVSTDVLPFIRDWLNALPDSPRNNYLREMCFSKFVSSDTDPADVRKERAVTKWLATEAVNKDTNERLLSTPTDMLFVGGARFSTFCDKAREIIASIIGDMPDDLFGGSFSGGASTSRKRTEGHPALKFVGEAHATASCLSMIRDSFESEYPVWAYSPPTFKEVEGNIMFTVPKNTVIDRVCCKEPDINMFLQKGLGDQLRRALRKVGNNLNDQTRNRELARLGSIDGSLATMDLSSASDSISYSTVELLLPTIWFSTLSALRCERTLIPGHGWHNCEMFSSMGNGFTFELESLLFLALARTTAFFTRTKGVISVYGDDIVIPSSMYEALRQVLFYFGFTPNDAKSFHTGPFRESCGGHYWCGDDITPFFIRGPINRLTDLMHLLNQLRLWAARGHTLYLNDDAWDIWSLLSEEIPKDFKGGDIDSAGKFQLISPDRPRKRLSPVKKDRTLPEEGCYLQWLCSPSFTDVQVLSPQDPVPDPVETTEVTPPWARDKVVASICYKRRARRGHWHNSGASFLTEDTDCGTLGRSQM